MRKFYKICLFIIFFGVFLALAGYFFPSSKKEIGSEKREEIIKNTTKNEEGEIEINNIADTSIETAQESEILSKTSTKEKEVVKSEEADKAENTFKIKQRLVSWGYSPAKNRSINTIIIHSSFNALGGEVYSVDKLIEEYKEYGVSPHYLIDRDGNAFQLVSDSNIAYHAGESKMPDGRTNINSFSLGIEIMTTEKNSPTDAQYASLNKLIDFIKRRYEIKDVLGHNQIAPGRKTDPWNFNWSKITSVK